MLSLRAWNRTIIVALLSATCFVYMLAYVPGPVLNMAVSGLGSLRFSSRPAAVWSQISATEFSSDTTGTWTAAGWRRGQRELLCVMLRPLEGGQL